MHPHHPPRTTPGLGSLQHLPVTIGVARGGDGPAKRRSGYSRFVLALYDTGINMASPGDSDNLIEETAHIPLAVFA